MTTIYLYCTKAKPWLYYDEQKEKYALRYGKRKDTDLNGTVCFKCECNEAFDISKVVQTNKNLSLKIRGVYDTEEVMLYRGLKTALTLKQIEVYQGTSKRLFALHFEKVEAVPQVGIDDFAGINGKPLKKAPQSWCYASRWLSCKPDEGAEVCIESPSLRIFYKRQMCIIISIRPEWLCKIANGEKKTWK